MRSLAVAAMGASLLPALMLSGNASAHGGLHYPQQRDLKCMYNDLKPQAECTDNGRITAKWQSPYNNWAGIGEVPWKPADDKFADGGQSSGTNFLNKKSKNWLPTVLNDRSFDAKWVFTAPHNTTIFRLYITKPGWQPGDSIKWSNIEEFCSYKPASPNFNTFVKPLSESWRAGGGATPIKEFEHNCTIPDNRSGRHAVVSEWVINNTAMSWWGVSDVDIQVDSAGTNWGYIGSLEAGLSGAYGDSVEVTFMGDHADRHDFSFSFAIASSEQGQPSYLSKTIADEINHRYQTKGVIAGVLDYPIPESPTRENINVKYGANQVYTRNDLGISSMNIVVKPGSVEPGPGPEPGTALDIVDVEEVYTLSVNGQAVVSFDVQSNKFTASDLGAIHVSNLDSRKTVYWYSGKMTFLDEGGSFEVNETGNYRLTVIGGTGNDSVQQTADFRVVK